jgi:CheY-like chemotaxis protein
MLLAGTQILIVDDEEVLRETLAEIFLDSGAIVVTARNGYDAFEIVKKQVFDVVVSDIRMPGGNGIEFVENINRYITKKPEIFLCTGFSDLTDQQAAQLGVTEVFAKPFNSRDLIASIAQSMSTRSVK